MHLNQTRLNSQLLAIPDGDAGTRATLNCMRRLVRQYKKTLPLRQLALRLVRSIPGKDWAGEVRAVHRWVRGNVRYVRDINGVETLTTPDKVLEILQGDCDDQSVLVATLLEAIGHPTRFVAIGLRPLGPFQHVYAETKIKDQWIPLETTEPWPMGVTVRSPPRRMVLHN